MSRRIKRAASTARIGVAIIYLARIFLFRCAIHHVNLQRNGLGTANINSQKAYSLSFLSVNSSKALCLDNFWVEQFIGCRQMDGIAIPSATNQKGRAVSLGHSRRGGTPFRVGDCQIWAEIHYLDSPTDYREYLPAGTRGWERSAEGELCLLDDEGPHLSWARAYPVCGVLLALSVALAVGFLMLR